MGETKETKICKHCQSEIPAKAKVCPNCRKKQGGMGCLGVILLVVGILIALFAFIRMMGGSDSKDKNPQKVGEAESNDSAEAEEPSNVFQVGDIVETDNFRITYESAGEYEPDNEFLQAKDRIYLLGVQIQI